MASLGIGTWDKSTSLSWDWRRKGRSLLNHGLKPIPCGQLRRQLFWLWFSGFSAPWYSCSMVELLSRHPPCSSSCLFHGLGLTSPCLSFISIHTTTSHCLDYSSSLPSPARIWIVTGFSKKENSALSHWASQGDKPSFLNRTKVSVWCRKNETKCSGLTNNESIALMLFFRLRT